MSNNTVESTLFRVKGIDRLAGRAYTLPEIYSLLGHGTPPIELQSALDYVVATIKDTGCSYISDLERKKCGQPMTLATIVAANAEDYREQPTVDDQVARLQRRILELEAKVADYKRALRSAYRCVAVVQDAVQEAETNLFNWQEELRDE